MDLRPRKTRKSKQEDSGLNKKKPALDKEQKKPSSSKTDSISQGVPDSNDKPPPGECAICKETITDEAFTHSCCHTFCFICLEEWSKVKPECPLCKQEFDKIIHNVQNDYSHEVHYIDPSRNLTEPRFQHPTMMTPFNFPRRNLETYQDNHQRQIQEHRMNYAPHAVRMSAEDNYHRQIQLHRMNYAPHAVRMSAQDNHPPTQIQLNVWMSPNANFMSRTLCRFRNRVYLQNLWIQPNEEDRTRPVSPELFRRNLEFVHRLLPWLNRELIVLLQNNETMVTFVLELIMDLLARFEIRSQEFEIHMEPYLFRNTRHFIHELYHFSTSTLNMEDYDSHATYLTQSNRHHLGPGNEVRSRNSLTPRKSKKLRVPLLKKIIMRKNGEQTQPNLSNPGPSTSSSMNCLEGGLPSTLADSEDDEIQVLQVILSNKEKSPDIVDLSSDEEDIWDLSSDEDFVDLFSEEEIVDLSSDEEIVDLCNDEAVMESVINISSDEEN